MEDTGKNIEFEAIKAMYETGKIKKLSQLEKLSPTKLSKLLGINYGRYIEKLHNPELFALRELVKFADIIDIEFKLLADTVINEIIRKKAGKN
ncbi:MAG TPA: hypothetical protein VL098_00330 [Flavipsychrobacter sp.]|nr:hypothetical protein [Flavipsychrobacter sp.]